MPILVMSFCSMYPLVSSHRHVIIRDYPRPWFMIAIKTIVCFCSIWERVVWNIWNPFWESCRKCPLILFRKNLSLELLSKYSFKNECELLLELCNPSFVCCDIFHFHPSHPFSSNVSLSIYGKWPTIIFFLLHFFFC